MAPLTMGKSSRLVQTFRLLAKLRSSREIFPPRHNFHHTAYLFGVKGIELRMPALSPTMTEGTIIKWLKNEGDTVQPGDVLCEIQTDKAVVAYEIEDSGILAKILKDANSGVQPLNTLIGLMVEEGQDWKDVDIPAEETVAPSATGAAASQPKQVEKPAGSRSKASMVGPAVKHLLDMYGLKAEDVPATGPHNVLLKADVARYVSAKGISETGAAPAASPAGKPKSFVTQSIALAEENEYEDVPLTNMRRAIAKRLTVSKTTIPHSYMNVVCNIDETLETRKKYAADGIKVSVNDFIIKAAAMALHRVPAMNAIWKNESLELLADIDISIAVATDTGLITPIVKAADVLGIDEIATTVKELASRAREGKLKPNEFEGGCFSISNLGMFGISQFSAVINPPQASILAIGGSALVPGCDGRPLHAMAATLSYDARVITEETAAEFVKTFKDHMEQPLNMLGMPLVKHSEAQEQ
ncbi:pyruvate dehydrogenase protein X component, mitochondrial-like [Dermacentor variabilis]|uniref:pyruvate dehydrogenase protein X component, mitochondrial-like n=1 Tax=Dermacentor variabilis TaxID=34621 RepID=UPI003F5C842A